MSKLLRTVNISAPLETLKDSSPAMGAAIETFLENFKGMSVHQDLKITSVREDCHDCTYINLVLNKTYVRAILDTGAPGNIVSSRLAKKLKLAPDLA